MAVDGDIHARKRSRPHPPHYPRSLAERGDQGGCVRLDRSRQAAMVTIPLMEGPDNCRSGEVGGPGFGKRRTSAGTGNPQWSASRIELCPYPCPHGWPLICQSRKSLKIWW